MTAIFHLAFPVANLDEAKAFYADGLGCQIGRESSSSAIFNLQGHQIVAQVTQEPIPPQKGIYPRHFGLVFTEEKEWEALANRARDRGLKFYQEPRRRFEGILTEHRTFFLEDPFHNLLEFKYYCHWEAVFEGREIARVGDRP